MPVKVAVTGPGGKAAHRLTQHTRQADWPQQPKHMPATLMSLRVTGGALRGTAVARAAQQ